MKKKQKKLSLIFGWGLSTTCVTFFPFSFNKKKTLARHYHLNNYKEILLDNFVLQKQKLASLNTLGGISNILQSQRPFNDKKLNGVVNGTKILTEEGYKPVENLTTDF